MFPTPRAMHEPLLPRRVLSLSSAVILTLVSLRACPTWAKVARPGREEMSQWRASGPPSTVVGRPVAAAVEMAAAHLLRGPPPARRPVATMRPPPAWEEELPEEMEEPVPLPLPPLRRTTKRPAIVPTNGTLSETIDGDVDGSWPYEGSTSRATPATVTTVPAVPLYVIDAPERSQAVAAGNCGPGERWHNNRCRTVVGGR